MNKQRKNLRIKQAERIAHLKRASISELEKESLIIERRTKENKYNGDYEDIWKNTFECIYLSVDGKCNENYCLGTGKKDNETIEDCPRCVRYNNCLFCHWFYRDEMCNDCREGE